MKMFQTKQNDYETLKKDLEQLRREVRIERMKVSKSVEELSINISERLGLFVLRFELFVRMSNSAACSRKSSLNLSQLNNIRNVHDICALICH